MANSSNHAQITSQAADAISLSGKLDFYTVPAIAQQAKAMLSATQTTVDLAGVEYSDSAGLALLTDWLREARKSAREVCFVNPPEQMRQMAQVCGLDAILGFKAHAN